MNAPIFRLFALFVGAVRRARRRSRRAGPCSAPTACARTRRTAASCSRSSGSSAASSAPPTARCWPAARRCRTGATSAATRPGRCSRRPSASRSSASAAPGLERYYNDQLDRPQGGAGAIVDSLVERDRVGDDLKTTLVPEGAEGRLRRARGPQGRRRRARRQVRRRARAGGQRRRSTRPSPKARSTFNLATQGLFPPGSTFKTVTATAAIDSGRYQPESRVSGKNGKAISGTPLNNFGSEDFGEITLTEALTQLRQYRLGRGRRQARARDDAGVHGPLRLR